MADDPKKPDAFRLLTGQKDLPERPNQMYRQSVHHTPQAPTATPLEPTKEGRDYLTALARAKQDREQAKASFASVPLVGQRAPSQERVIQRDPDRAPDKIWEKDKGDDLER